MNTPAVASTRPPVSSLGAWMASNPRARTLRTLVLREFWEHRSLWLVPQIGRASCRERV